MENIITGFLGNQRLYIFVLFIQFVCSSSYHLDPMSTTLEFGTPVPGILSLRNIASVVERFSTVRSLKLPLAIFGTGLLSYIICNIIYNVYFHPYARYPGPYLAKFTDLYAGYHAWKGDIHLDMWRCHQVYGDKVRYAPNRLNINTVMGLKSMQNICSLLELMLMPT